MADLTSPRRRRLAKLAALTKGAALVSSLVTVACDRSPSGETRQPPTQPIINAPPQAPSSASVTPPQASDASTQPDDGGTTAAVPTPHLPIPNAPNRPRRSDHDASLF
jgi:hypothetical protein